MGFFDGFFDVGKNIKRGTGQVADVTSGALDTVESSFNLLRGRNFETTSDANSRKRKEARDAGIKRNNDLLSIIKQDEQISEATRLELTNSIINLNDPKARGTEDFSAIDKKFKDAQKAKEGSVFASRQGTEALLNILKDKPGRSQFVSSGRSKNSLLGG